MSAEKDGQAVVVNSNSQVTQWTDQSTNSTHFKQTNVLYLPTFITLDPLMNKMPSIFFDGNNNTLTNPIILTNSFSPTPTSQDITICAVCYLNQKQTTTQGITTVLIFTSPILTLSVYVVNTAGSISQIGTCRGLILLSASSPNFIGFDFTPNVPFILTITLHIPSTPSTPTVTPIVYINGQTNPYNIAAVSLTGYYPMYVNSVQLSGTALSKCMCGAISHFSMYTTVLSTTQRQQLEGYLAYKYWGNGAVLGTSHPYYNTSPNDISTLFNSKTFN